MTTIDKKRETARTLAGFIMSGHANPCLVRTLAMLLVDIAKSGK